MKDYYEILGVSRGADQEEIKKAYRRLARLHHPDVSTSDDDGGDRFKEIRIFVDNHIMFIPPEGAA